MKHTLETDQYREDAAQDERREERANGKCPVGDVRRPRFSYAVCDFPNAYDWSHFKRVVFDSVTGAERAFEMDEVEEMAAWKDSILNKKVEAA